MQKVFNPKSVAIIGASEKGGKIGNILMKNIKTPQNSRPSNSRPANARFDPLYTGGSKIKIFPVNPKGGEIEGLEAYTSVLEIAEEVDLAVIAVPAKFVNKVVEECAWREIPIKNIIIISAGFGEAGEEGEQRKEELEKLVKEYDLNILGPNCLGIINATENINLSFAKKEVKKGGVGLISQSGAFITAMIDLAEKELFGFSLIASLGNKIDINENDLLDYYSQDKNTKIIAVYLENISNGIEFQKKLQKITKSKPVVIIKAGITDKTKQAIQSHTGSMAGESAVIQEAIKDAGGVLVDNLEDFVNLIKVLEINNQQKKIDSAEKFPNKNGLVIVTNAGGPGVITTDLIENSRLQLFEFTSEQKTLLKNNLPAESSVNNPIDLLGDALEDRYQSTIETLQSVEGVDGVLVLITPQSQTPIAEIIRSISNFKNKSNFQIFPIVIGGRAYQEAKEIGQKIGINIFQFPVELIRALSLIKKDEKKIEAPLKDVDNNQGGKLLSYQESMKISKEFSLNILEADYPKNVIELRDAVNKLGLPIVMKVDSPNIIHKNARNGVVVGLRTIEKVEAEFERFQKDFPGEKILVQHQVKSGLEVIIGLKRDETFGLVLVLGLGGITTEILDEKILFVGEVNKKIIKRKLTTSKLLKIFKKEKINETSLIEQAEKLFKLGQDNEQIKEVDVNPMFFYSEEEPVIVDFKIITK
jgi:acetyltransferase